MFEEKICVKLIRILRKLLFNNDVFDYLKSAVQFQQLCGYVTDKVRRNIQSLTQGSGGTLPLVFLYLIQAEPIRFG